MIQIGINGRVLAKPTAGGVGRYTYQLLSEFKTMTEECSIVAVGAEGVSDVPAQITVDEQVPVHSGFRAHLWEQVSLPLKLRSRKFDVFHTPAGHPPIISGTPLVTTIHDISPITNPEWFTDKYVALYRLLTPLAIRASARIITVSDFARQEILERYPAARGKVVAIHNGVTPRDLTNSVPCSQVTSGKYLLFVGSANPRKNLKGLLKAYRKYRQQAKDPYPLVLVGPDGDVFAETDIPDVNGVQQLGFVSEEKLTWLYSNAALFVFPSLYEGFGLPILEAMSVRTPVVTSDRGAMAEVADDAAHLVDPINPNAIAAGIQDVLDDREYRETLCQKGKSRSTKFSWSRTARRTLEVYREVADES
ncbi:MAG: glycosyltransferase family 4 protein [Halobacteriaceae archaeon]